MHDRQCLSSITTATYFLTAFRGHKHKRRLLVIAANATIRFKHHLLQHVNTLSCVVGACTCVCVFAYRSAEISSRYNNDNNNNNNNNNNTGGLAAARFYT
uniref:Uncharacterized protein n=1 Tax=Glossina palpalis gambiensis TaxID=67801 RepID=A0A1B0BGM2_9MUSC